MSKFKIGDRVVAKNSSLAIDKGMTGTVDQDDNKAPWVKWDNDRRMALNEEWLELYDEKGEEWIWVRRKYVPKDLSSMNYTLSWFIQRKHISSKNNIPCKDRVLYKDGRLGTPCHVAPAVVDGVVECTEYEAETWFRPVPVINNTYKIF